MTASGLAMIVVKHFIYFIRDTLTIKANNLVLILKWDF